MEILWPLIIVGVIGLFAGLGLSFASKFMAVPVDEKQEKIREALPGANCGACGYTGCDGYAAAIAAGEAKPDKCAPGGESTTKLLSEILGVEVENTPKIAFIACRGNCEATKSSYAYNGIQSCTAAIALSGGPVECKYGCLGFGDCAAACPFGAITLENGRPVICQDICMGCGKCVVTCPKSIISIIRKSDTTRVACSNKKKGAPVVKMCKNSCIACGMCERVCESGAIKVINNLAVIDNNACTQCGKCKEVCKRGVIV